MLAITTGLLLLNMQLMVSAAPQSVQGPQGKLTYVLVFDAGSTSTKLHIFKCKFDNAHSTGVRLLEDVQRKMTPGLSSYKKAPSRAADNIRRLLEYAKTIVPEDMWEGTGAAVRATAGMRLIDRLSQKRIEKAVVEVLQKSVFKYTPDLPFKILTGTEEAEFGWMTINAHLDRFTKPPKFKGIVDMGGASCQIAFVPPEKYESDGDDRYMIKIKTIGGEYIIHAHSYLGLGGGVAKLNMFGFNETTTNPESTITSICLNEAFSGKYRVGNTILNVRGKLREPTDVDVWKECYQTAISVVKQGDVHMQAGIDEVPFVAIASFYYHAKNAGIISRGQKSVNVKVKQYLEKSKQICENPPVNGKYMPFQCMDLMYVYALLRNGFGMSDEQELLVLNKIDGFDAGWAYGFAIHYLSTGQTIIEEKSLSNVCCSANKQEMNIALLATAAALIFVLLLHK